MADEEKTESPKPKKELFGIIFLVLNLVVMSAGMFMVYSATLGVERPSLSEADLNKELDEFTKSLKDTPVVYSMNTFITNLEGIPRRIIKMELSLEMLDEEGFEEVIEYDSQARNAIIKILNKKQLYEIDSVQGKLKLKNEIIASVNTFLENGVVKNVYFTDLAVQ